MLKLTRLADYAFVLLRHLSAVPQEAASTRDMAAATGLPLPTVRKLLKQLAQAGIVEAQRGVHGGYRLAHSQDRISVADVIVAIDGPVALTECASHRPDCERIETCTMRPHWLRVTTAIQRVLTGISLEDISRTHTRGCAEQAPSIDDPTA